MTLPRPQDDYDRDWASRLVSEIESRFESLERLIQEGYTVSNGVENRTLDVSTATLAETKEVVGTLIDDMKERGLLG